MNLENKILVPVDYTVQQEINPPDSYLPKKDLMDPEVNSLWSFGYYQKFFEITTDQVLARLMWSMFPKPGINYFKEYIQYNPDLYGPIWISLTLIFTVTIGGNLGSYFQLAAASDPNFSWKYDFHLISLAATCILSYCWLLPLILWGILKWNSTDQIMISYLELTCVYGYCLTIFIPISVLWVIQIDWLQWFLACLGTLLSGTVLLKSILPVIGPKNYFFIIIIFCCHFLLSVSLLWNFFQGFQPMDSISDSTTISIPMLQH